MIREFGLSGEFSRMMVIVMTSIRIRRNREREVKNLVLSLVLNIIVLLATYCFLLLASLSLVSFIYFIFFLGM